MSEINHNRMIPLHIADQAVAACEKENSRLKAEVERLRKAGDALVNALLYEDGESCKEIADWNAAKEGKPNA